MGIRGSTFQPPGLILIPPGRVNVVADVAKPDYFYRYLVMNQSIYIVT